MQGRTGKSTINERPRGEPRGIKECNTQELRSKLRGIHHPALGLPAEGKRKRDKLDEECRGGPLVRSYKVFIDAIM
jgi:hypothetical protein